MRIQAGQLIPLGHGIWVRSDEVVAVEPVRENRGPGRRARVWVRGIADPLIASRSEDAIRRDLVDPSEVLERARRLETTVSQVADSLDRVPPLLLRMIKQETGLDLKALAADAREATGNGTGRRPGRRADTSVQQPLLAQ
ncbi:MAG: hypothetical protein M0R74_05980 [Dehalococcoidia bacterium]|nr:hypothetical protein [Dehalococcoidia bacterium]